MIALGIALVLGLLAVYLANVFLTRSEERANAEPEGTTRIAVAAVPLDYGTDITPDKVRFVAMPTATLPAGSFRSLPEMLPQGKRRVAIRPMTINEPILASKLAGEGLGASIAALLPDGMRAASVRINDVSGVAGFIQPTDSVDVLITRPVTGDREGHVTDLLLQDVKVLAMDQNAKDANGQPVLAKTATLEVDPTEAQKLALAQQLGQLSLVLRKPGEQDNNPFVETVSLEDLRVGLYGSARHRASAPAAAARPTVVRRAVRRPVVAAPARPVTNNVQVVRGTEGSSYEVGGYDS